MMNEANLCHPARTTRRGGFMTMTLRALSSPPAILALVIVMPTPFGNISPDSTAYLARLVLCLAPDSKLRDIIRFSELQPSLYRTLPCTLVHDTRLFPSPCAVRGLEITRPTRGMDRIQGRTPFGGVYCTHSPSPRPISPLTAWLGYFNSTPPLGRSSLGCVPPTGASVLVTHPAHPHLCSINWLRPVSIHDYCRLRAVTALSVVKHVRLRVIVSLSGVLVSTCLPAQRESQCGMNALCSAREKRPGSHARACIYLWAYIFHPLTETELIALPLGGNERGSRPGSYIVRHMPTQNTAAALRTVRIIVMRRIRRQD